MTECIDIYVCAPIFEEVIKIGIYYIKLQRPFACVSVCTPPPLSTRPSDRDQIRHTYSDRYGTNSQNGTDTCQQRNCIYPTLGLAGLADHDSAFIVMKFQLAYNYKVHHACYLMQDTLKSAYKNVFNDVYM